MPAAYHSSICKLARAMSGSCLLGGAISVEADSSLTISVCFLPGSIQRGAFFLTV